MPDEFHYYQPQLLRETFRPARYDPEQVFVGTDLHLYYTIRHPLWHKRPDWFAVLGIERLYEAHDLRMSYVMWQQGVAPYLVAELLSPGTEQEDLGQTQRGSAEEPYTKWDVYSQILRVPYYVVFSRYTDVVRYFTLNGAGYREMTPGDQRLWLTEAGIGLGLWTGTYHGMHRPWLRFYDANGLWIPIPVEQERQRAERLAAQLRALGIDPEAMGHEL